MSRDLDISLLRAFSAVVETGSVTAAARMLNRTQAAVSLQIKRLEDSIAQQLFDRGHRRLSLTPAGERLIAQAQRIVAMNDELMTQMTTPDFEGEIRFGVPTDIVQTYMPPILRRFSKAWPRVRLAPRLGNSFHLLDLFRHGDLDLALTTDTRLGAGGETLRVDRLVWVGAPGGSAHRESPLPLAVGDTSCRFRPSVIEALRKVGRDWRFVLEVSNQVAQDATVSAGIAVGASLRDSVPDFLDELNSDDALPSLPEYQINLYAPKIGLNPLADELARHVRQDFTVRFGGLGHGLPTKPMRPPRPREGL
jgi:DNA-binding transcriptional LysR family regulator